MAARFPDYSRNIFIHLIREGKVLVGGSPSKPSYQVTTGDEVVLTLPATGQPVLRPQALPVVLLYEDDYLMAVDKPPGLAVHPGAGRPDGTLLNALLATGKPLAETADPARPGLVHRLDKGTSGVLLVAKTGPAHAWLSRLFAERKVAKEYLALVHGQPAREEDELDWPLGRDPVHREKRRVDWSDKGRPALTRYRVRERLGKFSLVSCYPRTGRTHQIRVHLAKAGHPILCDRVYGRESSLVLDSRTGECRPGTSDDLPLLSLLSRQALHAHRLVFAHPVTGKDLSLLSPLPEDFIRLLTALRGRPLAGA